MAELRIKTEKDVYEAIDLIHTRVIDNLGEDSPLFPVLETALEEIDAKIQ